jgi:hypothetical protein
LHRINGFLGNGGYLCKIVLIVGSEYWFVFGQGMAQMTQICIHIRFLFGWCFCRSMFCVLLGGFVGGLGGE